MATPIDDDTVRAAINRVLRRMPTSGESSVAVCGARSGRRCRSALSIAGHLTRYDNTHCPP